MAENKMHEGARTSRQVLHSRVCLTHHLNFYNLIVWFAAIVLLWGMIIGTIYYVV